MTRTRQHLRRQAAANATIRLDPGATGPIYRQIQQRIRAAILDGRLPPGARLPSWNSLASQLGVARGTVKAAYEWLGGEGYVIGRGPAGTIVNPNLPPARPGSPDADMPAEDMDGGLPNYAWGAAPLPFQMGIPALDAFPRKSWSAMAARQTARLTAAEMAYPDPAGYLPLRQAIAAYLAVARGIVCEPSMVFVTAGFTGALGLIASALLRPGDRVWMEDPGFPRTRTGLVLAGASIVPVPVDAEGLNVAQGMARGADARLAVVTPSHQAPLGMQMSPERRIALLDWAARSGGFIIEDDYYGEFRFQGPPAPALKSLDAAGRVIYVGSFSKVLLPGIRLGYIVPPPDTARRIAAIMSHLMPSPSLLMQMTLAGFMASGQFGRHVSRMRTLYTERRAALVAALQSACGERLRITMQEYGMHLLGYLPDGADDVALARRALQAGLGPAPLSPWAAQVASPPGLLMSFTNVPAERARHHADRLAQILAGVPAR